MPFARSLAWRVALSSAVLLLAALASLSVGAVLLARQALASDQTRWLIADANLVAAAVAPHLFPSPDPAALDFEARRLAPLLQASVAIFSPSGAPLAVSDGTAPGGAAAPPEVQQALAGHAAQVARSGVIYLAAPVIQDGRIVGAAQLSVPAASLAASATWVTAATAGFALLVAALAVALAFWLTWRSARSLRRVAAGAQRLAAGDLSQPITALASGETGDLARSLNRLAQNLRLAESELAAQSARLNATLGAMTDGLLVAGDNGELLLMNAGARQLLNLSGAPPVGRRLLEVTPDHELGRVLERCQATRQPQQAEVELLRPRRLLNVAAFPVAGAAPPATLLLLRDLSRPRQLEVTQREFVSNVSHELRNPLASIKVIVETLEDGALEDPRVARDFLRRMNHDIDRMSHVVNDLLELSRLESGQVALRRQPVALRELAEETCAPFHLLAQPKAVVIVNEVPPGLPPALGDPARLRQVLTNLLDNALKFTPAGGRITVSAQRQGELLQVAVRDTGAGIPQQHLPHIFERFYKVDRARHEAGTGLGLAIVKQLVEAHGGTVGVTSQEGVGAVFTFTLPLAP